MAQKVRFLKGSAYDSYLKHLKQAGYITYTEVEGVIDYSTVTVVSGQGDIVNSHIFYCTGTGQQWVGLKLIDNATVISDAYDDTYLKFKDTHGNDIEMDVASIPEIGEDGCYVTDEVHGGLMSGLDKIKLEVISEALNVEVDTSTAGKVKVTTTGLNLQSKFDGGDAPDTLSTITSHGNLPKNTTIADLEEMTLSEVFKKILFETAAPTKKQDLSASISLKNYETKVDVGADFPTNVNFNDTFNPEKWNWTSADGTASGTPVALNTLSSWVHYYKPIGSTEEAVDLASDDYTTADYKAAFGTNGHFYGIATYVSSGNNAVDSLGSDHPEGSDVKYKEAYGGTKTTGNVDFTGAYRMYTNASYSATSPNDIWAHRSDEMSLKDEDAQEYIVTTRGGTNKAWAPVTGTQKIYLQWPVAASAKFYVYVPTNCTITKCGGASDTVANTFDATIGCTKVLEEGDVAKVVSINNPIGTACEFNVWEVGHAAGKTSVEITVSKA